MAQPIGSLYVSLTADVQPYAQALLRAQSTTTSATRNIQREAGVAERSVQSFWGSVNGGSSFRPYSLIAVSRAFDNASDRAGLLRGALLATTGVFGGFIAALSSNLILRYADSFTKLNNQVRVVSESANDGMARFEGLTQVANNSRSSLEATVLLYSRLQKAAPYESADKVLQYVETIQKALTLGGATAEEARSAAIQFSQAIASNRLGGDELRAVLETPLGLELARGLNMTIGQFREAAHAGKITATEIFTSLSKIKDGVDQQFSRAILTVDQALTTVDNQLTSYLGRTNQAYGFTKLLAGAILGLGNNLDTIGPIVGTVGGLLFATFAGRGASALGGGLINAIRSQAKEAKEKVVDLRSQLGSLQQSLVSASIARSSTARAVLGDSSGFADPAAMKALQRGEQVLTRSRDGVLAAIERRRQAELELQNVTAVASPRAVKLTNDVAAAEQRVSDSLAQQAALRQQLVSARSRETAALGIQTTTGPKLQATKDAVKDRIAIERTLAQTEQSIGRDRQTIVAKQIQIDALATQADQKAAQQRIEALRRVQAATKAVSDARTAFGVAGLDLADLQKGVATSGDQNARRALEEQTQRVRQLQSAIQPVSANLVGATRAATGFGIAGSFLSRQASALVGLFGGPWGVAITGAIAVLGYLGLKSQETAEKIASAQKLIDDALERSGQGGDKAAVEAKISNQQRLAERIKDAIKQVDDEYQRISDTATSGIASIGAFQQEFKFPTDVGFDQGAQQIQELVDGLRNGKVTVAEFKTRLQEIGGQEPLLKSVTGQLSEQANALDRAQRAAQLYRQELNSVGSVKLPPFRDAEIKSLDALQNEKTIGTAGALVDINQEIAVQKLRAQGLEAQADALKKIQKLRKGSGTNGPQIADREAITDAYKELDAWKKKTEQYKAAQRALENFTEKVKRMKEEAQGAFLGDVDRSVLQTAREAKTPPDVLAKYVQASKTGNFSGVDAKLLDLRSIELTKKAGAEYRNIIDQYGTWAQIAPLAKEKQAELDTAVANGAITAGQAKLAYADFLAGFANYKWINSASDAIGNFVDDAVADFGNLQNAWLSLWKNLEKIAIQEAVSNPIRQLFKSFFGQVAGGGLGLGSLLSGLTGASGSGSSSSGFTGGLSGLWHTGGVVGSSPPATRVDSPSFYSSAPRFHTGLTSDEFRAILKRGEHVLTSDMAGRTADVISGLSRQPVAAIGGDVQVVISNVPAGYTGTAKKTQTPTGLRIDVALQQTIVEDIATAGPISKAMERQYGLNRAAGAY